MTFVDDMRKLETVPVVVIVSDEAFPSVVLPFTVRFPDILIVLTNIAPTSKITLYLELLVFVSNGALPLEVCALVTMYILPSLVSLTRSLST